MTREVVLESFCDLIRARAFLDAVGFSLLKPRL